MSENDQSSHLERIVWRSKVVFFKAGSWSGIVHLAGDASPKAPTVGKAIHGTLFLGVLPRTKSRRFRRSPLQGKQHLTTLLPASRFSLGVVKQNQKLRIKPEFESGCFFSSFDLFFCFFSYTQSEKRDGFRRVRWTG